MRKVLGFGVPSSSQPQPPRAAGWQFPATTASLGAKRGINAAAFSCLLSASEEKTLLSGDKHRGAAARPAEPAWPQCPRPCRALGSPARVASPQSSPLWD